MSDNEDMQTSVEHNVFSDTELPSIVSFPKHDPTKPVLTITDEGGQPTVSVFRDGHVEFGEGVDPEVASNDAARTFWDAIQSMTPY